jgi:RNA polymerase sigma factor (sigma-70 family)
MTEKERSLLAGCLNGEKAAWDSFVLQYSNLVYHTIKKTLSLHYSETRADLVEDLYQEFFVSLLRNEYKKLRQFRGAHGCSLASWLRILTARLTIDFLRKLAPASEEVAKAMPGDSSDPAERLVHEQQERVLNRAIQTLSPRDNILLDLCYRQGLSTDEIAVILKASVPAVYTQKSRLLDKIREILKTSGSL